MTWDQKLVDEAGKFLSNKMGQFTTPQFITAAGNFLNYIVPGLGTKLIQGYNKGSKITSSTVYARAMQYLKEATRDAEEAQRVMSKLDELINNAKYGSMAEQTIDRSSMEAEKKDAQNKVIQSSMRNNLAYQMQNAAEEAVRGDSAAQVVNEKINDLASAYEKIKE